MGTQNSKSPEMEPPRRRRRPKRLRAAPRPDLTINQILDWADSFRKIYGRFPRQSDGRVKETLSESWRALDLALRDGYRGLPGSSSLAQLFAEHRGYRNKKRLPLLPIEKILAWADSYHARNGKWPTKNSGEIPEDSTESWKLVDLALMQGSRGLSKGSSLAQLLAEHRGVRNIMGLPPLRPKQILQWADAHYARTGEWPTRNSGEIPNEPGETWRRVNSAMVTGGRGLLKKISLAQLLEMYRGVRNTQNLPPLKRENILGWADEYHARTGEWPKRDSGAIPEAAEETWGKISAVLMNGGRGWPKGSSLAQLLEEHRGVRNQSHVPQLSVELVLQWADAHHEKTGTWPTRNSGRVEESPDENWGAIHTALKIQIRGFKKRTTLAQLLLEHRGVPKLGAKPGQKKQ